ncbi:hypothetical protein D9M69_528970 [compost metagenome]
MPICSSGVPARWLTISVQLISVPDLAGFCCCRSIPSSIFPVASRLLLASCSSRSFRCSCCSGESRLTGFARNKCWYIRPRIRLRSESCCSLTAMRAVPWRLSVKEISLRPWKGLPDGIGSGGQNSNRVPITVLKVKGVPMRAGRSRLRPWIVAPQHGHSFL